MTGARGAPDRELEARGAPGRELDRWVVDRRAMLSDRWLRGLAVGLVGWLALCTAVTAATADSGRGELATRSAMSLLPLAAAGALAAGAARRVSGRDRTYWVALAAFCGVRLVGELIGIADRTAAETFRGWGTVAAGSRLAEYVPALVAAVFVCGRPSKVNGLRGWFDVSVVSAAACYLGWQLGIVPALGRGGSLSALLDATTPVLDNLVVLVALSAGIGARQHILPARLLAIGAFVCLLGVDSIWSWLVDIRGGSGTWLTLAYQLPAGLLALAAVAAWRYRGLPIRVRTLSSRLPMISIIITCFAATLVASSHPGDRGRDVGVSVLAVAVVIVRSVLANTELRATAVRLERARGEQERLAVTDGLTGLYNRRFFEEFLLLEAGRSTRTGAPVSLVVADLDHFKRVNDALGHPVGDRVLVEAARRLRSAVRDSDVVARYGGEEFAVVLPETDPPAALEIAERCRQALHGVAVPLTGDPTAEDGRGAGDGPGVVVTGSFGVATLWAIGDATVADLVRAADRALYRAKATGRNRVAPAGEWDFLTGNDSPASVAADPVADALFRAAELLEADRSLDGFGTAVGDWAGVLAGHLGLDARTRERCVLAGRLRDIGKLAIPLSVLTKPGPLTDAEWLLMRTHPEHGEALVALAPSVADLGPVVRGHHERIDGGGYPDKLAGAGIPVEARIVALCDAWAAMRTSRVHAAAGSVAESRRKIARGRGTQFDPALADLFLSLQEAGSIGAPADRPSVAAAAGTVHPRPPVVDREPSATAFPAVGALTAAAIADRVVAIATQPHEHAVLERLVEAAQELVPARYAVALLVGPEGIPTALAHRGMTAHDVAALPHLPRPVGLVGAVLAGKLLRLARLADHPDSVGFPTGHVPMGPLLGLPVIVDGRVQGGLYLTRAPGEPPFTDDAEQAAKALVAQAGTVLVALRAAIVSTAGRGADDAVDPAQQSAVIRQILASARTVLGVDLSYRADIDGDHRTSPASTRLEVRASYGVPVHLPDGTPYGTLLRPTVTATSAPTTAERQAMATVAGMLGQRLAEERASAMAHEANRAAFLPLLDGDRSTVVVQPIVDLTTGITVGFEALSRFTDPSGAPRRPDQVFAEAALVGLGVRFELTAARAALQLLPDLPPGAYLSINLSPQAVCDPRTYDLLHDLPLGRVVVELTEHEQVSDYTTIVAALAALRVRGLRLAIDDAGSGFAGLHHLAELSPDLIKLDIAFVRHIDSDPTRRAVARAVIGFAGDVGATLIAEGIETPAELDELRRLGAPLGQGFLLGRPGPPRELLGAAAHAAHLAGARPATRAAERNVALPGGVGPL